MPLDNWGPSTSEPIILLRCLFSRIGTSFFKTQPLKATESIWQRRASGETRIAFMVPFHSASITLAKGNSIRAKEVFNIHQKGHLWQRALLCQALPLRIS